MPILMNWFLIGNLFKKYKGNDKTTKEITKPNVGEILALNPAYTGTNNPITKYKEVIIKVSINETEVKPIIKTINSCNETLTLVPKGIENIPTIHMSASMIAFLVNRLICFALSIAWYIVTLFRKMGKKIYIVF